MAMNDNITWEAELAKLKSIVERSGLTPEIKWGMEVYTHKGKNVVGFLGFKQHFALWFYNGVFLKDPYKVLVSAQEGKTKAMRQWRFTAMDEIDEKKILEYIHEAIINEDLGMVWKPEKSEAPDMPMILDNALKKDKALKEAFLKLTPYKQKEYIEHIGSAKREETRQSRLEKAIPMILKGIGINDKYK